MHSQEEEVIIKIKFAATEIYDGELSARWLLSWARCRASTFCTPWWLQQSRGEEQSSRLIRGDQSSRHTQPRTTATSPSGKSELRGKSGDKKLIWQISGWLVAASGGRGCCWCCHWLISGAHLTVWTQISGDSGVTTVNMSTVQCSQCPVSNTLTMFIPIHTHNWSSFTFYIHPWQSSHYPDI